MTKTWPTPMRSMGGLEWAIEGRGRGRSEVLYLYHEYEFSMYDLTHGMQSCQQNRQGYASLRNNQDQVSLMTATTCHPLRCPGLGVQLIPPTCLPPRTPFVPKSPQTLPFSIAAPRFLPPVLIPNPVFPDCEAGLHATLLSSNLFAAGVSPSRRGVLMGGSILPGVLSARADF